MTNDKPNEQPIHAKYGPSKSNRWLECHASIRDEASYPSTTSRFAQEGSAAHRLAELVLLDMRDHPRRRPTRYLGKKCDETELTYTQEMLDAVEVYRSIVYGMFDPQSDELHVEIKLHAPKINENFYGTVDALIVKKKKLVVVDFKYGKGVAVHAENNTQMLCYTLLAHSSMGVKRIRKFEQHIVQPRLDDPRMRHTQWGYDSVELMAFSERVVDAIRKTKKKNPKYSPSEDRCRFCKAQAKCLALQQHSMKQMADNFELIDLEDTESEVAPTPPAELTPSQISTILAHDKMIRTWLDSVRAFASDSLLKNPESIPGFKMVEGRSIRKWREDLTDAKIVKQLTKVSPDTDTDEFTVVKLKTPAQMERLVGKGLIDDLIFKPPGSATIAPEDDPRKPMSGASDFD